MYKAVLVLLVVILLSYCKEKEDVAPGKAKIYFTGLTQTDINAWPLTTDTTDWKTNDSWIKQEQELFSKNYQSGCSQLYNYKIIAYPNPSSGLLTFSINKPSTTYVEMSLVDENFNVLYYIDSLTGSYITLNGANFGIKDTIRLYYRFIENNCEFKGHGDILLK